MPKALPMEGRAIFTEDPMKGVIKELRAATRRAERFRAEVSSMRVLSRDEKARTPGASGPEGRIRR
jgi:hypothetical protein